MIKVNKIVPKGIVNGVTSYKIDFEFDNASALPIKVYQVGLSSYILADESSAFNTIDNDTYIYRDGKWNKTPGVKPDKVSNINNITKNGNYSIPNNDTIGINNVNVNVKSSGDNELSDVVFYDYDGTILYEYTKEEFLKLKEMPKEHTRKGLISRGWNWDFESAHNYVEKYGMCDIGQQYETDDGSTRIYFTIPDEWEDNIPTATITLYMRENSEVSIDWGDGSDVEILTGLVDDDDYIASNPHQYATTSNYVISIKVTKGIAIIPTGRTNSDDTWISAPFSVFVNAIELGDLRSGVDMHRISNSFDGFINLTGLLIPYGTINIGSMVLGNTKSIGANHITIPTTCVNVSNRAFESSYDILNKLSTISLPYGMQTINDSLFDSCSYLKRVLIPDTVLSIGEYAFNQSSVNTVIVPDSVTSLGDDCFSECEKLTNLYISNQLVDVGAEVFMNCLNLKSIILPDTVENMGGYMFHKCSLISSFNFPNGVTSIENNLFDNCSSLTTITVSSSVESIADSAFNIFDDEYVSPLRKIIINKPKDSISGAPWGAPDYVQIIWNDET